MNSAGEGQAITVSDRAVFSILDFTRWSSRGQIAYSGQQGVRMCAPDGGSDRVLVPAAIAGDFNRAGDLFYALKRDGAKWKRLTVAVADGHVIRSIEFEQDPLALLSGASLNTDGKRLAFGRHQNKYDIWMLEGPPSSGDRLDAAVPSLGAARNKLHLHRRRRDCAFRCRSNQGHILCEYSTLITKLGLLPASEPVLNNLRR
jgi:hypothetical protein